MSYNTIHAAANDEALRNRITAAGNREAYSNEELGNTPFGEQVKGGFAPVADRFAYPVAVGGEAAYASAVAAGNPNPGGDESVVTDGMILSAIQATWPMT